MDVSDLTWSLPLSEVFLELSDQATEKLYWALSEMTTIKSAVLWKYLKDIAST